MKDMNGLALTDFTVEELKTIYTALGAHVFFSASVTEKEKEMIDQFRTKLCEAAGIVRQAENVANN